MTEHQVLFPIHELHHRQSWQTKPWSLAMEFCKSLSVTEQAACEPTAKWSCEKWQGLIIPLIFASLRAGPCVHCRSLLGAAVKLAITSRDTLKAACEHTAGLTRSWESTRKGGPSPHFSDFIAAPSLPPSGECRVSARLGQTPRGRVQPVNVVTVQAVVT